MENPEGVGGPKWNSLHGGGLDIFWNYTLKHMHTMSVVFTLEFII